MSTSKYFLWLLMMIFSSWVRAQSDPTAEGNINALQTDTIIMDSLPRIKPQPFIRLGLDVSAVARQFIETEVKQYEISLDSEVYYNWFAILEGGIMSVEARKSDFNYDTNGFFFRLGADYNLLERPTQDQNNIITIGARYAFSHTNHESSEYFVTNPYWGNYTGSLDQTSFQLHWLEFSGGMKTEVFKNFYLGWSIKARVRLAETKNPALSPYYIGGFGHGKRNAPIMMHYSILYKFGF